MIIDEFIPYLSEIGLVNISYKYLISNAKNERLHVWRTFDACFRVSIQDKSHEKDDSRMIVLDIFFKQMGFVM